MDKLLAILVLVAVILSLRILNSDVTLLYHCSGIEGDTCPMPRFLLAAEVFWGLAIVVAGLILLRSVLFWWLKIRGKR